jgi:type IV pilus assembly protein PilA
MKSPSYARVGFTLIEILIVIGIIAVLAAIVVVAINPARQFALARNSQRVSNVNAILNAIGQNMADNKGIFICASATLPPSAKYVSSISGDVDLYSCVVPTYLASMPIDPGNTTVLSGTLAPYFTDATHYQTGYQVSQNTNGRITVCAVGGAETSIAGSIAICVTR